MNFPTLHIAWTAGKNLALPGTLSRNTPTELLIRKTTVEIPQNLKFYLAKDETSPRLECKHAVGTDIEQSQMNNLYHNTTIQQSWETKHSLDTSENSKILL